MKKITLILLLMAVSMFTEAEVLWPNKVKVTIAPSVSFDTSTGQFTYHYAITSGTDSIQDVAGFYIPLRGATASNIKVPRGWTGRLNLDATRIGFCACEEEGFVIPPNYVQDGRGLPSIYDIKPGQTLAGFSFQSQDPPSTGTYYAKGWVPVPVEGEDFPAGEQQPYEPDFPFNLFAGETLTPSRLETIFAGGRRPAVDTFLVFLTLKNGDIKREPLVVDLVLGPNGEVVDQSSFRAKLNSVDVTSQFVAMEGNKRRGYFLVGPTSPLRRGKNILTTTINGQVPETARTATDTDKLTFTVQ